MRAHPTCLLMPSCEQTPLCIPGLPHHVPLHHMGASTAWTFPSFRLDREAPGGSRAMPDAPACCLPRSNTGTGAQNRGEWGGSEGRLGFGS